MTTGMVLVREGRDSSPGSGFYGLSKTTPLSTSLVTRVPEEKCHPSVFSEQVSVDPGVIGSCG